MKKLYSLYTILILSWPVDVHHIYDVLTPTMVKFMVLGAVVPPIAIWMLFKDENSKNPTVGESIVTYLTSLIFVWLGYEASMETGVPVVLGLVGTFLLGLSSLPIIMKAKTHIIKLIGTTIDSVGDWVKNKTK